MKLIKDYKYSDMYNCSLEEFILQIDNGCCANGYEKDVLMLGPSGCRIKIYPKQEFGLYHNSFLPEIMIETPDVSGPIKVSITCKINRGVVFLLNLVCGFSILLVLILALANGPWEPENYLPLILPAFALLLSYIVFSFSRKVALKNIMPTHK